MIIVDNHSSTECTKWIELVAGNHHSIHAIFLDKNKGGQAINLGLERVKGNFVLISENDLEYLPNWDLNMLAPFYYFPELGQLSPFSPYPMTEMGEVWSEKPFSVLCAEGIELKVATQNIGTSCLIRKEIIDSGVRIGNLQSKDGEVIFPADAKFSTDIKQLGYTVAWSNQYQVLNWGHIKDSWETSNDYYQDNWMAKASSNIDGLGDYHLLVQSLEGMQPAERESILKIKLGELLQELEVQKNSTLPSSTYTVTSTMFVSTNNDFASDSVSLAAVNPYSLEFEIVFDLTGFDAIDQLRWDPYEGRECRVNLTSITMTDQFGIESPLSMEFVQHNGVTTPNSALIVFDTTDPKYVFPVSGKFIQCRLQGKWAMIEPDQSQDVFAFQIGKVLPGKYKFEFRHDGHIESIEYFETHPILSEHFEHIEISAIEMTDKSFLLALSITSECDDLWIQCKWTEGYEGNYQSKFDDFSKFQLTLLEQGWDSKVLHFIRRKLFKTLYDISLDARPRETYSTSPEKFNEQLAQLARSKEQ
jgi:hypothetical protein